MIDVALDARRFCVGGGLGLGAGRPLGDLVDEGGDAATAVGVAALGPGVEAIGAGDGVFIPAADEGRILGVCFAFDGCCGGCVGGLAAWT